MRPSLRLSLLPMILIAAHGGNPARAELYKLDGQFQCLERPEAVCHDATPMPAEAAPAKPQPIVVATEMAPATMPTITAPLVAVVHAGQPVDPIAVIAQHVRGGTPGADDLETLRRSAKSGHAAAIELLAWCALKGVGTRRDPVEAYLLYGAAASADVRGARENQSIIYARELSSQQRQKVAEVENQLIPVPSLSIYAAAPQE